MIPLREQNLLRERFARDLKSRVRVDFFTLKPAPIFIPGRECVHCDDVRAMLQELASLNPRISLTEHYLDESGSDAKGLGVDRVPATVVRGQTNRPLRFFGMPSGGQFPVFIEMLIAAARGTVELQPETVRTLRKLRNDVSLRVLVAPSCPYSPVMAWTAYKLGLQSVRVKVDIIEVGEYPAMVRSLGIAAVPVTLFDDGQGTPGVIEERELAEAVLRVAEGKQAAAASRLESVTRLAPEADRAPMRTSSGLYLPR